MLAWCVVHIIKQRIAAAGMDPAGYSGHSLRAGLVTSAAMGGATEHEIMLTTGHKSGRMVRKYICYADLWKQNAAKKTGL